MSDSEASVKIKTEDEIKKEPEDEDTHECTPRKRRRRAANEREAPSCSGGARSAETQRLRVALRKTRIKTEQEEEEEEWCGENEDSDGSDPDYIEERGGYSDSVSDDADNDDVRKTVNGAENGAEERGDSGDQPLKWKTRSAPDVQPPPTRFKPLRPPGPALDRTASWTPLSVFQLFFSNSVLRKIVDYTNKRAARFTEAGRKRKWTPLTIKELYIFLTTVLYSSLVKLHKQDDYWKRSWPYDLRFPVGTMNQTRFVAIYGALSLCSPEADENNERNKDGPEYDKLLKVKLLYEEMVNASKSHFHPNKNICINERRISKNKPLRCGFRLFALADSQTGYTWNLHIYTGKTEATRGQSAGYTAVMNLLPVSVLGSGYTLYTDSLFSSPRLFKELRKKNIGCCGILNKHHPQFPKTAQNDFPSPASRGDIRWLRKDSLLFVKWMDTREVSVCSTVHEAFTGQVMKRPVREAKGMVSKQFSCPDAVADFNRHMIVPDRSDTRFTYQSISQERMGNKWHHTLFYYLFDIAIVNSYVLYKELGKLRDDDETKSISQKTFREELCKEMLKFGKGTAASAASSGPPALTRASTCMPMHYVDPDGRRQNCRWCHNNGRKKVKTIMFCRRCLVPLCLTTNKNCFSEWHDSLGANATK